ncbi:MAG: exodeoxyribonuclease VII small subunit [Candidatus Omnitrophica bacterium]|nr:exodeoxyribonuclease VII small subunit [Candidatus Omnitrophota bacterium]MCM8817679.1 exodeoxyribonuclease VII small subunit [Candidatus Omnitrophota bacterium]
MKEKEKLKTALQRLEKIVEELNRKDIDVEQGLEKFREGVELIKFCRSQLQKAENEFIQLKNELEQIHEEEPEPQQQDE